MAKTLVPVVRPRDAQRSSRLALADVLLRTGNHMNRELATTPLENILKDPRSYAARPADLGIEGSLITKSDKNLQVAAQAAYLPVPRGGKVEFTPVVYPSATAPESAAVLTIMVTRQGTSMQVIPCEGEPGRPATSREVGSGPPGLLPVVRRGTAPGGNRA